MGYSDKARKRARLARSIKSLLGETAYQMFLSTGNYDEAALNRARGLNPRTGQPPRTLQEFAEIANPAPPPFVSPDYPDPPNLPTDLVNEMVSRGDSVHQSPPADNPFIMEALDNALEGVTDFEAEEIRSWLGEYPEDPRSRLIKSALVRRVPEDPPQYSPPTNRAEAEQDVAEAGALWAQATVPVDPLVRPTLSDPNYQGPDYSVQNYWISPEPDDNGDYIFTFGAPYRKEVSPEDVLGTYQSVGFVLKPQDDGSIIFDLPYYKGDFDRDLPDPQQLYDYKKTQAERLYKANMGYYERNDRGERAPDYDTAVAEEQVRLEKNLAEAEAQYAADKAEFAALGGKAPPPRVEERAYGWWLQYDQGFVFNTRPGPDGELPLWAKVPPRKLLGSDLSKTMDVTQIVRYIANDIGMMY